MFVCGVSLNGGPTAAADLFQYLARLPREKRESMRLVASGSFAAAVAEGREARRPLLRRWGHLVGVGDVRLDNRAEVTRWSRQLSRDACDLEVVLAAVAACGPECLTQLAGDFALVLWDASTHRLVAVRDALGVRSLFYRSSPNLLVLSSSLSALSADERYDAEYIADFLVSGASTPQRTIWAGTSALPAGTILIQRGTVRSFRRYWCAADFLPEQRVDEPTAIERFRELFTDAVRCRIGDQGTWAQLSGGLDSSSIVATVQSLREDGRVAHGLAGTVTVVDALGEGDETAFSDLVVQRFQLRNEQIANHWLWQEDGAPPLTEEPRLWYPFFARDRRLYRTVADAGGSVLLSGLGADHYLYGSLNFFADHLGRGHVLEAVRGLVRWSVATRQSFWQLAARHALHPLLPLRWKRRFSREWEAVPPWLNLDFARRLDVANRRPFVWTATAPAGHKFANELAMGLERLPGWMDRDPCDTGIELRYPFLSRALVEFSLQLPVELRVRPGARKWILRQAMRGILPERVRARSRKGGIEARMLWSLQRERQRVKELLRAPMLEQLGCVRADVLRQAVEQARCGHAPAPALLFFALSLETWLAVRSGRWKPLERADRSAA